MDSTLNLQKQQELQEIKQVRQEMTSDPFQIADMPFVQTESKEMKERTPSLQSGIEHVAESFQKEWGRFKVFAYGTETGEVSKNRSGTATDLMDCLIEMNGVTKDGEKMRETGGALEKLFELSQAADNYYVSHQKKFFWTKAGEDRFQTAKRAREMASNSLKELLTEDEKREIYSNENVEHLLGESDKTIEKDLKKAAEAYRKYRLNMAENCLAYMPGGETLHRKLRVLRVNDRLIRLYRDKHPEEEKRDKLINEMIRDYEECLGWEKLRTVTRQKEESFDELIDQHLEEETEIKHKEEEKTAPADAKEDLHPEQLKGIEEIDNWLISTYKAGSNDDAEMYDRLFSMSKRERLHIYYLIEKKRRRNADMSDVGKSQTYTPTLKGFKNQMLATKFKFWKRLGGDYLYSHKISDALLVTEEYRKEIKTVAEVEREQKSLKKNEEGKNKNDKQTEAMTKLLDLKDSLEAYRTHQEDLKKAKTTLEKKGIKALCDGAREKCETIAQSLRDLEEMVAKEKIHMDQGESRSEQTDDVVENYSLFGYLPNLINEKLLGGAFELGTEGITSLISAITGTIILVKNGKNYSREEVAERSMGISTAAIFAASSGVQLASKFVTAAPLTQTAAVMEVGAPVVGAVLSAGIAIAQGVAAGKMDYHGNKAVDYFLTKRNNIVEEKEKEEGKGSGELSREKKLELKYEANMLVLQDQLKIRQQEKAATSGVGAGLFIMGTMIPVLLIPALATFIVGSVREYKRASNMQAALFDRFFNMDELAKKALEKRYQSKKLRLPDNGEDKKKMHNKMKEALRLRIAARAGFNSVKKATEYITSRFARLIHKKLFSKDKTTDDEEKKGYIELVKGLNLRYNEKKKLPDERILARRLNAQG